MNGSVIREPSRSLKEQFSRSSEAWKEQSDPIFRFWAEGDVLRLSSLQVLRCWVSTLDFAPTGQRVSRPMGGHQSLESYTQWQF